MRKALVLLLLLLYASFVSASVGDITRFSNHYGQLKEDVLVIEAYLVGDGCFYNSVGGSTYTNINCNSNSLGVKVNIKPSIDGYELVDNYDIDGYDYLSSVRDDNCLSSDFSYSCFFPYQYYVWVASDDIFNFGEIKRYTKAEIVTENNYNYYFWSDDLYTLALYDNIVYADYVDSVVDLEHLEAVRYGFRAGSTGDKVCSQNVRTALASKSSYFANTNDIFLNAQSCSLVPENKQEFYSFDRLFYDTNINYWSYPYKIKSIIVKTTTTDGSEYFNGIIDPKGQNLAPNHRYSYIYSGIDVLSDSFVSSDYPFYNPTGYDSVLAVPLDTSKYDVSDIDNVKVEVDFYVSDEYRHKSPLDKTAHFNDLFSGSDMSVDNVAVRYTITLSDIVSEQEGGNESNDAYNNVNATINGSASGVDKGDVNFNDFDSGFDSNEFEDEIEGLTRIAKTNYVLEQQTSFFSKMYGVALLFFGVFLTIFTLLSAVLFFAVIGLLFFGLWSSMFKAIDEIFKWW